MCRDCGGGPQTEQQQRTHAELVQPRRVGAHHDGCEAEDEDDPDVLQGRRCGREPEPSVCVHRRGGSANDGIAEDLGDEHEEEQAGESFLLRGGRRVGSVWSRHPKQCRGESEGHRDHNRQGDEGDTQKAAREPFTGAPVMRVHVVHKGGYEQ